MSFCQGLVRPLSVNSMYYREQLIRKAQEVKTYCLNSVHMTLLQLILLATAIVV